MLTYLGRIYAGGEHCCRVKVLMLLTLLRRVGVPTRMLLCFCRRCLVLCVSLARSCVVVLHSLSFLLARDLLSAACAYCFVGFVLCRTFPAFVNQGSGRMGSTAERRTYFFPTCLSRRCKGRRPGNIALLRYSDLHPSGDKSPPHNTLRYCSEGVPEGA